VVELSNGLLQIQRAGDWNADGGQQSADPDNRRRQSTQPQTSAAVTLHSIRGLATLIFQHCPLFYYKVIALKSRTFVLKSRTT
jgi:hypothetical protein